MIKKYHIPYDSKGEFKLKLMKMTNNLYLCVLTFSFNLKFTLKLKLSWVNHGYQNHLR